MNLRVSDNQFSNQQRISDDVESQEAQERLGQERWSLLNVLHVEYLVMNNGFIKILIDGGKFRL